MKTIILDTMGGDFGPKPVVDGAMNALKSRNDFNIILVGDSVIINTYIDKDFQDRISIVHTSDYIQMTDSASLALKRKESSIYKAVDLFLDKKGVAVVSAGHSGATMSVATLRIGRIPQVLRPAIAATMPRIDGKHSLILDVGANVDCKPEYLCDFATMGYEYAKSVLGYKNPRVGLLSNGEEESKGNELTKATLAKLKDREYFIGNVEGSDIFNANVEVVVCDGFTGNIVLKTSEGAAKAITTIIKQHIKASIITSIGAFFMKSMFFKLKKQIDYTEYGGAPLLGVNGVVIISHGKSDDNAIKNAIFQALKAVESDITNKITKDFNPQNK